MGVLVGTSGWSYPEWRPAVYPAGLPRAAYLRHYGTLLGCCEVNGTFHRLQAAAAVAGWAGDVPAGFRFVPKVHRGVVRAARLASPGGDTGLLDAFLESVAPLRERLGAVLVTFHTRTRDDDGLRGLLACLPDGVRPVVDPRDPSWDLDAVHAIARAHGGAVCVTEAEGGGPGPFPDGDLVYVRLRGERYDDAARGAWVDALHREGAAREVYVVARHEGLPPDDPHCGVGLALWLRDALAARAPLTAPAHRPPGPRPGAG